jgi:hypothetical protein
LDVRLQLQQAEHDVMVMKLLQPEDEHVEVGQLAVKLLLLLLLEVKGVEGLQMMQKLEMILLGLLIHHLMLVEESVSYLLQCYQNLVKIYHFHLKHLKMLLKLYHRRHRHHFYVNLNLHHFLVMEMHLKLPSLMYQMLEFLSLKLLK